MKSMLARTRLETKMASHTCSRLVTYKLLLPMPSLPTCPISLGHRCSVLLLYDIWAAAVEGRYLVTFLQKVST